MAYAFTFGDEVGVAWPDAFPDGCTGVVVVGMPDPPDDEGDEQYAVHLDLDRRVHIVRQDHPTGTGRRRDIHGG